MQVAQQKSTVRTQHGSSRRAVAAFTGLRSSGRVLSVQVFAKKGKTAFRSKMGQPGQMMGEQMSAPPVPEVDPENVEFVIFVRCKNYKDLTTGQMQAVSPWIPLSVVKGGQSANFLVRVMESDWGNKLYGKTLIRNIANAVYKDRADIEKMIRQKLPAFAAKPSKDFEYAFKIRDKSVPKEWQKAEDLIIFPSDDLLREEGTAIDQLRKFFSGDNIASMFGGAPSTPAS